MAIKKYIPRIVIIFFFVVLFIFLWVLLKSCYNNTIGVLDENKIENLKGAD